MKIAIESILQHMRGRISRLLFMLTVLGLLSMQSTATAQVHRIKFKPGATSTSVTGRLKGWKDQVHYVIRLRPGQTMTLSVEGKCDDCYAEIGVETPNGADDSVDTDMCLCRVEVTNTVAGDYRITIGENRKGGKWKGSYVLEIKVL